MEYKDYYAIMGVKRDSLVMSEKEREMTIDLGFAWLTLPNGEPVGIIDVRGHRGDGPEGAGRAIGEVVVELQKHQCIGHARAMKPRRRVPPERRPCGQGQKPREAQPELPPERHPPMRLDRGPWPRPGRPVRERAPEDMLGQVAPAVVAATGRR